MIWGNNKKEDRARVGSSESVRPATAALEASVPLSIGNSQEGSVWHGNQYPDQAREAGLWSQQQPNLGWQGWVG